MSCLATIIVPKCPADMDSYRVIIHMNFSLSASNLAYILASFCQCHQFGRRHHFTVLCDGQFMSADFMLFGGAQHVHQILWLMPYQIQESL